MSERLTLDSPALAERLGVSEKNLRDAIRRRGYLSAGPNKLWPIHIGSRIVFGCAAVEAFTAAIDEGSIVINAIEAPPTPAPSEPVEAE